MAYNRVSYKQWYLKNRDKLLPKKSAYMRKRREDPKVRKYDADQGFISNYGITPEERDAIVAAQSSVCSICTRTVKLVVDHDHVSGKFRGMICSRCNTLLGQATDNTVILLNAVKYLEQSKNLGV